MSFDPKTAPDPLSWLSWIRPLQFESTGKVSAATQKWVLMSISARIDASLSCFPKRDLIESDTQLSTSAVSRAVGALVRRRLLFSVALRNAKGQTNNFYVPNINGWLDDCTDISEVADRVAQVYRYRDSRGKLLPDGARIALDLCVEFSQVDTPGQSAPGTPSQSAPGGGADCPGGQGNLPRQKEVTNEGPNEDPPPTPPQQAAAPIVETPGSGGEESESKKPEERHEERHTEAVALILRSVTHDDADRIRCARPDKRDSFADAVAGLLEAGVPAQKIVAVLGKSTAGLGDVVAGLHARLDGLTAPVEGSGQGWAVSGAQGGSERRALTCGDCWEGPRSYPRWRYRYVPGSATEVSDDMCSCHPDYVTTLEKTG